eukprot:scaffold24183_cov63-Phaeocystis_antarctica.AAC.2
MAPVPPRQRLPPGLPAQNRNRASYSRPVPPLHLAPKNRPTPRGCGKVQRDARQVHRGAHPGPRSHPPPRLRLLDGCIAHHAGRRERARSW